MDSPPALIARDVIFEDGEGNAIEFPSLTLDSIDLEPPRPVGYHSGRFAGVLGPSTHSLRARINGPFTMRIPTPPAPPEPEPEPSPIFDRLATIRHYPKELR